MLLLIMVDEPEPRNIFIVYCYNANHGPKRIIGTFFDLRSAIARQEEWCRHFGYIGSRDLRGVQNARNNDVTFVNKIPLGACNIELFTTRL